MNKHFISVVFLLVIWINPSFAQNTDFPFLEGETVNYDIKKFGITAGHAQLTFKGLTNVEGQELLEIVFQADTFKFKNVEQIYFDPVTFFPVLVKRKLKFFGKNETAEERYDQAKKEVVIKRNIDGKDSTLVIKKDEILDNIYCFIYRYRNTGNFDIGEKLNLYLPTRDVEITLLEKDKIKVGEQKVNTFYFKSESKDCCNIWFGQGKAKIPLRIDGVFGFARVTMVMSSYTKE